ncbi:MAG: phosphate ABC transporter permease subunit PstC [Gammaproteobacteria bacterium]
MSTSPSLLINTANKRYQTDKFAYCAKICAISLIGILCAILFALFIHSNEALRVLGAQFFTSNVWDPPGEQFGVLAAVYGTLVTAAIAMVIAGFFSITIAFYINAIAPAWLYKPLRITFDMMAGIPSIIFGMWGLFVFAPIMANTIQPMLQNTLGALPLFNILFAGAPLGIGILTASIILALMLIPFMTSMLTDVFSAIPMAIKEAAFATGATLWEVFHAIILPYSRSAIAGSMMLGLGRAMGETMAVTFVIGNAHKISSSLFAPGTTISSTIANEFADAAGTLYPSALMALGLVLFVITMATIFLARWILKSYTKERL